MKRLLVALWALLLAFSVAACGGRETPNPPVSAPAAPSHSGPASVPEPPASLAPEPAPLPELRPGRILALGDERLNFSGTRDDQVLATQAELDRWNNLIPTAPVVRMDFCEMHQEEKELTVEQEQQILAALRGAALGLYPPDYKENPSTGGGYTVVAYDGEENVLFHVVYIGDWFTVQFGSEKARCIFDGEGTTLDDIWSQGW